MKTTKSKQQETKRVILQAAVDLLTEHGFDGASMKQIARAAGIGDATIYKYFPTKEKLVLGYFEQAIGLALADTHATKRFDTYTLQERLQRLVDALLARLLPDREFVAVAQGLVAKAPMLLLGDALPGKLELKQAVVAFLEAAETSGEIPPFDFKPLLGGLFVVYLFAVIVYWLKDRSDEFADTTRLVDLTLAVLAQALQSGLINKLSDLAGFLLRSQLARVLQGGGVLADWMAMGAPRREPRARG
jgi:AcrR family transcriptional regulator